VSLADFSPGLQEAFFNEFKPNGSISFDFVIFQVVRCLQVSLCFLDLLNEEFTDGFFCDKTLEALEKFSSSQMSMEKFSLVTSKFLVKHHRCSKLGLNVAAN
jgi:hypothetical protein